MTDAKKLFEALRAQSGEAVRSVEGEGDDTWLSVAAAAAHEVLGALKERHGYNVLVDVTAADFSAYEGDAGPRFEVTYRLLSLDAVEGLSNGRLAVKVRLADGEALPRSAMDLWPAADWLEREVWDMFGIRVADRPDMKRLLMYEEFQGHPLRKDYAIQKRQPLIGPAAGEREDNPSFNHAVPTVTAD